MQAPSVVIVTQPGCGPPAQTSNWHTGLCDCFTDCEVCLCGTFCLTCLACQVAGDMNECCLCGTSVAMRTLYRTRYGIPGSLCDDCLVTNCCLPCSLCQIKRDIRRRIATRTF
ncbi:placenta-specific gene 8 protein-like [Elephas maximus indicus]|uniref:placenta-specific gene 8 protein-like n=1 Tax=Elephas maximus indicus TaxID=99487 RepID=UPI0021169184|nr:placenta-specific gene 8 protein-like [Elephas maximus indicus]XP_049741864.1 placenta-specific gene 8 protein-like [Elephas maximus indicus]XP_049741865.1 placenta-specific gene 8 protein-like [Elephas maximus indicus]